MADDFPSLVSLACHDLRTPLATVQGFAKTLLRLEDLDAEKSARYLGLIDAASDELVELLDLVSLAARILGKSRTPPATSSSNLCGKPPSSGNWVTLVIGSPPQQEEGWPKAGVV